jgi:hypothetical protein
VAVMVVVVEAVEVGSLRLYVLQVKLTCHKATPVQMRHQSATAVGKLATRRSQFLDFDSVIMA